MSDVRLTATNPEDSSAVPVACNDKGELLLQEIPDYSFDGDLEGNLTVSGTGSFSGTINGGAFPDSAGYNLNSGGVISVRRDGNDPNLPFFIGYSDTTLSNKVQLNSDGSATFAGVVNAGSTSSLYGVIGVNSAADASDYAALYGACVNPAGRVFVGADVSDSNNITTKIYANGSASFAGGKAGFTADGNLWCTTVRGDTVMLDATSGGIGAWIAYTPPTRRELLEERITEIKDAAIKPSQDLPETDTGTQ